MRRRGVRSSTLAKCLLVVFFALMLIYVVERFVFGTGHPLIDRLYEPTEFAAAFVLCLSVVATIWWAVRGDNETSWPAIIIGVGIIVFYYLLPPFLVYLATSGSGSAFRATFAVVARPNFISYGAEALVGAVPLLLFACPAILRAKEGWRTAPESQRKIVLGWLAVAASFATGLYAILLHFDRGPLWQVPLGQLCVAVLFAVLVLVPVYKSIAKVFSERSIIEVCDPARFSNRQKEAARMVLDAFHIKPRAKASEEQVGAVATRREISGSHVDIKED